MSESEQHEDRGADNNGASGNSTTMPPEPVEAFPAMPAFPPEGSAFDDDTVNTKSDIKVSHIPLPPLPNVSASAPPTSTLPTIPGGHSDEDQSSDASSTHSKPDHQESSNSSSTSEPATAVEKKEADKKEDVVHTTRARAGSSSASMKKNHSHDNVRRLSAAGIQQLQAPEALPVAVVPDEAVSDQERSARIPIAEQLQAIRQSILSQPDSLRRNGPVTDGGSRSRQSDEWRRPISGRTLSTPPTNRRQSQSQTSSPRRNSFYTVARPPPLNIEAATHFNAVSPQLHTQNKPPQIQIPPPSQQLKPQRNDPFPPSPLPPSIPLPPMSIPTHLQLELAAQRPSPLYIHHSHTNDIPYESYVIKWERLKNVLLLPSFLERTLYFGALACLDAWLYNFTILPIRFCIALGVLVKWWGYLAGKEARWMIGFVWYGLGRVWARARRPRARKASSSTQQKDPDHLVSRDRSQSRPAQRRTSSVAAESRAPNEVPSIRVDSETKLAEAEGKPNVNHVIEQEVKMNGNGHTVSYRVTPSAGHHSAHVPGHRQHRHRRTKSMPSNLSSFHKADLLQGAVILCSSLFLMRLDASRMYHFIRAQDGIKLYVIYNVLEVGDRLLSAIGQDIFECLFSSETLSRNSSGRSKILLPMGMFALALAYNVVHSVSLYYQVITLNVAVNSYSNALLTLMISNQFVEIKSTVFKRFEKDNLFQLTCADIVERFQLWIMLLIIGMRNIVEVGGLSVPGAGSDSGSDMGGGSMPLHSPSILPFSFTVLPSWVWSGEVLSPFLIVIGSEMLVDTIKHAYVNKFNNIKPTFYSRILDILCKDYYTNAFVTPSLTRRLGLAVIPLSCLFIRASVQTYHMFLSTRIPTPIPESTQTSLSVESATPSSPVMVAALDRLDTLLRDALGRAVYGDPYGASNVKTRSWWSWNSDDVIAAVTMIVVFFIAFLVLLIIKLLLGMVLLRYSRNRYANMKRKEHMVATGQEEREVYDAKGKRVGGYGHIEVTEDRRRWIHADEKEGLKGGKGRVQKTEKPPEGDYNGVYRYEMIAKRIW
ncbi:cytomegalovirus gh-receptor family [Colletotrichum truncatum]|uniref:Cytomegalovirus gh-receptor family n=1 Tax=Colletotrichum truncatum TaxID=5467 RepID=A0ACC3ZG40_COLTU|nr:cytomegalovirus gh-receptor family [Colletotrichum truncatum]KAF6801976.1 cytomegalovirus gh-receptor family [Colletotrichum truncatum]